MSRLFATLLAAALACGVFAATAAAAPDRTFTFSATQTAAAWEGSGAYGFTPGGVYQCRAGTVYNCDDSLLDIKDGGTLKASAEVDSSEYLINFELYKAAADGTVEGDPVAEGELGAAATIVAKDLEPGTYVLRIVFRLAVDASFTAKATFTPAAPAAAPAPVVTTPPATADPAPAAAPKPAAKKKTRSCKAKAKKIKNAKKRKAALKRCARKAQR
jgi:hypothetical protein